MWNPFARRPGPSPVDSAPAEPSGDAVVNADSEDELAPEDPALSDPDLAGIAQEAAQPSEEMAQADRDAQLKALIFQFAALATPNAEGDLQLPADQSIEQYKPKTEVERKEKFKQETKERWEKTLIWSGAATALGAAWGSLTGPLGALVGAGTAAIYGLAGFGVTTAARWGVEWAKNQKWGKEKSWNEEEGAVAERIYNGEQERLRAVVHAAVEAQQLILQQEDGQEVDIRVLETIKAEFVQKLVEYRQQEESLTADKKKFNDMTKKSENFKTAASIGASVLLAGFGVQHILSKGVEVIGVHVGLGKIAESGAKQFAHQALPKVTERLLSTDIWHAILGKVLFHYTQGAGGEQAILNAAMKAAKAAGKNYLTDNFLHDGNAQALFDAMKHEGKDMTKLFWEELFKQKGKLYIPAALAFLASSWVGAWKSKGAGEAPSSGIDTAKAAALGIDDELLGKIKAEVDKNKSDLDAAAEAEVASASDDERQRLLDAHFERNPELRPIWEEYSGKVLVGRLGDMEGKLYQITGVKADSTALIITPAEGEEMEMTPEQFRRAFLDESGEAIIHEGVLDGERDSHVVEPARAEYGTTGNPYFVKEDDGSIGHYIISDEEPEAGHVILLPMDDGGRIDRDHPWVTTPEELNVKLLPESEVIASQKDEGEGDEDVATPGAPPLRRPEVVSAPEGGRDLYSLRVLNGEAVRVGQVFAYTPPETGLIFYNIKRIHQSGEIAETSDIQIDFEVKLPDGDVVVSRTKKIAEYAKQHFHDPDFQKGIIDEAMAKAGPIVAHGAPEEKTKDEIESELTAFAQQFTNDPFYLTLTNDGKRTFAFDDWNTFNTECQKYGYDRQWGTAGLGNRLPLDTRGKRTFTQAKVDSSTGVEKVVFDYTITEFDRHPQLEDETQYSRGYLFGVEGENTPESITQLEQFAGKAIVRSIENKLYLLNEVVKPGEEYSVSELDGNLQPAPAPTTIKMAQLSDWYFPLPPDSGTPKGTDDELPGLFADLEPKAGGPVLPTSGSEGAPKQESDEEKLNKRLLEITEKVQGQIFDFEGNQGREALKVDGRPLGEIIKEISDESGSDVSDYWWINSPELTGRAHISGIGLFDDSTTGKKRIGVSYRFVEIERDNRLADGYEYGGVLDNWDSPSTYTKMAEHNGEVIIRHTDNRLFKLNGREEGAPFYEGIELDDQLQPIAGSKPITLYGPLEWYCKKKDGGEPASGGLIVPDGASGDGGPILPGDLAPKGPEASMDPLREEEIEYNNLVRDQVVRVEKIASDMPPSVRFVGEAINKRFDDEGINRELDADFNPPRVSFDGRVPNSENVLTLDRTNPSQCFVKVEIDRLSGHEFGGNFKVGKTSENQKFGDALEANASAALGNKRKFFVRDAKLILHEVVGYDSNPNLKGIFTCQLRPVDDPGVEAKPYANTEIFNQMVDWYTLPDNGDAAGTGVKDDLPKPDDGSFDPNNLTPEQIAQIEGLQKGDVINIDDPKAIIQYGDFRVSLSGGLVLRIEAIQEDSIICKPIFLNLKPDKTMPEMSSDDKERFKSGVYISITKAQLLRLMFADEPMSLPMLTKAEAFSSAEGAVKVWTAEELAQIIPVGTEVDISQDNQISWPPDIAQKIGEAVIVPIHWHNQPRFAYRAKILSVKEGRAMVEILPADNIPSGFTSPEHRILSEWYREELDEAMKAGHEVIVRDLDGVLYKLQDRHDAADGTPTYTTKRLDDGAEQSCPFSILQSEMIDWYLGPEKRQGKMDFEKIEGGIRFDFGEKGIADLKAGSRIKLKDDLTITLDSIDLPQDGELTEASIMTITTKGQGNQPVKIERNLRDWKGLLAEPFNTELLKKKE